MKHLTILLFLLTSATLLFSQGGYVFRTETADAYTTTAEPHLLHYPPVYSGR